MNLAGIIALANKKVIIIDLDLRKPKIHLGFNSDNKNGISTILSGVDKVEDTISKSNVDNLDYITAGPIPINPSELIISEKMDELLVYLKSSYDMIVIDNPPVGIVTDGISSIQKADYPIYIVKANYSKKHYLKSIDRLIEESKIQNMAVILNGVEFGKGLGQNQNLGYGYAYGYGYYQEESELVKKTLLQRLFNS
jgi:capsular exopolysaccharide synthesis family protein